MLIFDAHLDLAMNALEWNRDLKRSIDEIRQRETGMTDKPDRAKGTVCLREMRRGGIGLCVATQIARIEHNAYSPVFGWRSQEQAWAQTQGQLAWYRVMEEAGQMAQIKDAEEMERLGIILDMTHLCDDCFWEALDLFKGPMWASHQNCRALVPHNRQFSDEQLKALVERGAVIGAALDAWMLVPGWVRKKTTPEAAGLTLEKIVEHIDHVCQIARSARHSGIGSDLDGAFGREQTPADLDTIADLARIPAMLKARGYSEEDVRLIAHGNFVRFLTEAWS